MLDAVPTAYDPDKVVEQLELVISNAIDHTKEEWKEIEVWELCCYLLEIVKQAGIVKEGGTNENCRYYRINSRHD